MILVGALLGLFIEFLLPWYDMVMPPIHAVLNDPSIASNPILTSMIGLLGFIVGYLFLPIIGATSGFWLDNSS